MIKINQILKRSIIIELVFIVAGFFLCRAEFSSNLSDESCDIHIQTRIELCQSAEDDIYKPFFISDNQENQTSDSQYSRLLFSHCFKITLHFYTNFVKHQLNSYRYSFNSKLQLILVNQKHNILHQSSSEDSEFPA